MKVFGKTKLKHGNVYFGQECIYVSDDEYQELMNVHIGKYAIINAEGGLVNGGVNEVTDETEFPSSFAWYKKEILEGGEPPEAEEASDEVPSDSWTKAQMKSYMDDRSISYNSGDTKADLLEKIEWHKNQ